MALGGVPGLAELVDGMGAPGLEPMVSLGRGDEMSRKEDEQKRKLQQVQDILKVIWSCRMMIGRRC